MKQPSIPCPRCNGNGAIKLTKALRSTLLAIQKLKSPTARQIHTHLKETSHVSTSHRRVERLMGLKLVVKHGSNGAEATYSEVK